MSLLTLPSLEDLYSNLTQGATEQQSIRKFWRKKPIFVYPSIVGLFNPESLAIMYSLVVKYRVHSSQCSTAHATLRRLMFAV